MLLDNEEFTVKPGLQPRQRDSRASPVNKPEETSFESEDESLCLRKERQRTPW